MSTILYGAVIGGIASVVISTLIGWEFCEHLSSGYNMMPPTGALAVITGTIIGAAIGFDYRLH
jgi:hypothetical protein